MEIVQTDNALQETDYNLCLGSFLSVDFIVTVSDWYSLLWSLD